MQSLERPVIIIIHNCLQYYQLHHCNGLRGGFGEFEK